jgi:hypothetical protein
VFSYDLHKTETPFGWIGPPGERRCRELRASGLIEQRDQGKCVQYRAVAPVRIERRAVLGRDGKTVEKVLETPVWG